MSSTILGYSGAEGHYEPIQIDTNGNLKKVSFLLGTHGNLFSNVSVAANSNSSVFDSQGTKCVDIVGTSNVSSNLEVYISGDNSHWYKSNYTIETSTDADFHAHLDSVNTRYLMVRPDADSLITCSAYSKS